MPTRSPTHGAAGRGRRPRRVSAGDRERAILETAERLLGARSLREISIEDLARGAGISRSSFYFYFPSKEAVLLTLLDRVSAEAEEARAAALAEVGRGSLEEVCRAGIAAFHDTFRAHRAVTLAAADARTTNPQVRELWSQVMEGWVQDTVGYIAAAGAGDGPAGGVPARDLAIVLNLMNERALHAAFAHDAPAAGEGDVVEALVAVWVAAISARRHGAGGGP